MSVTHSQSNVSLKSSKLSLIPLFHISYHQIILALTPKYPRSDHFSTPPPLVQVILFFLSNYYSNSLVSRIIHPSPIFYTTKWSFKNETVILKILPIKLRINPNSLPNLYEAPWSDICYSTSLSFYFLCSYTGLLALLFNTVNFIFTFS